MNDLVPAFLVTIVGGLIAVLQAWRRPRWESVLLLTSFGAHICSVFAQIWITRRLYGGGDLFAYSAFGETIAAVLRLDFVQFAPEVVKLLFHANAVLPVDTGGGGSSTSAMAAVAGFLTYFTGGSTYTLCLIVAMGAYFGKVALYRAFTLSFPELLHGRLLFAATLVPSAVFWSSALLKEGVAMAGVGYLVLGLVQFRRTPGVALAQVVVGAAIVGVVKAYILFPLLAAGGAWAYADAGIAKGRQIRPSHVLIGSVLALGGVLVIGQIFPDYALNAIAERAAATQDAGDIARGSSTYSFGDPTSTTAVGQMAFAPLALITSLFRPFLFESNSVQVAINALETTAILIWSIRAFVRRRIAGSWKLITRSPMLALCVVFTVIFGVAVGLTTTNLGTLSRYRMPLVPFFWTLVLALDSLEYEPEVGRARRSAVLSNQGTRVAVRYPMAHQ